MNRQPAIFVSHGAPTLPLEQSAANDFLRNLGPSLSKPDAILAVSAHWDSERPTVSAVQQPETIYDFHGFPQDLYRLRYPAPGAPQLADRVAGLLKGQGLRAEIDLGRGLDHGAWTPLILMYPEADIPVTQLSIQPHLGPEHHYRVGEALRPLRDENVLILASGGATHNLREFFGHRDAAGAPSWVKEFDEWLAAAVEARRTGDLLDYRRLAPHAARNHPTDEHLLPIFVALGAATPGAAGQRLHSSYTGGVISMDAYRFN